MNAGSDEQELKKTKSSVKQTAYFMTND